MDPKEWPIGTPVIGTTSSDRELRGVLLEYDHDEDGVSWFLVCIPEYGNVAFGHVFLHNLRVDAEGLAAIQAVTP